MDEAGWSSPFNMLNGSREDWYEVHDHDDDLASAHGIIEVMDDIRDEFKWGPWPEFLTQYSGGVSF